MRAHVFPKQGGLNSFGVRFVPGGGGLPYITVGDARRNFQKNP